MLSESTIEWGGLVLHGTAAPGRITFRTLEGWEGWDGAGDDVERPGGHGSFDSPVYARARRVLVTGRAGSPQERDAVLARIGASMTPGADTLRITHAGRTLTARARLRRYAPTPPPQSWGAGWFDWAAEWRAPDPLRYGDPVSTSTPFPILRGGLRYPLYTDGAGTDLGWLDYGEPSDTGRVILSNPGTADVPVQIQVAGPVPSAGFDVLQVGSDRRLTFAGPVADGSALVLDGATGAVLIDGTADRAGRLTWRDWPTVPAGGSVELAFVPRGAWSEAQMTAVIRPGWW